MILAKERTSNRAVSAVGCLPEQRVSQYPASKTARRPTVKYQGWTTVIQGSRQATFVWLGQAVLGLRPPVGSKLGL